MKKVEKKVSVKKSLPKKTHKLKTKGISKVALLAVGAVVLIAAGGFYMFTQQKSGMGGSALPFVKAPLNPNCKYNDPELCKFMNNWQVARDTSINSTSSLEGMTMEYSYQMSGDNKSHMIMRQNGKENMNVITIADTTYTLDYKDNKWWKQTATPDAPVEDTSPAKDVENQMKFDEKEMKDTTSYKFISKEACGDLNCFKYQIVDTENTSDDTKQYIYFDDKEYLMRKMLMQTSNGESSEINYSYEKLSITEPSPVKEGKPDAFGGIPGYSEAEMNKMMQEYQQDAPNDSSLPVEDEPQGE